MKTSILSRHRDIDDTLRRYIHKRIQSALSVLVTQVKGITVHLRTEDSADGLRQKACEIEIDVGQSTPVVVKKNTPHWLSAIDQAVEAAARAVRRQLASGLKTLHAPALTLRVAKG